MTKKKQSALETSSTGADEVSFVLANHSNNLLTGLNSLRSSGQLIDVTIVAADGKSFRAHRNVLSAASNYFRAMFTTDSMKESTESTVTLYAVDSEGVGKLIDYAYTCKLTINWTNVLSVLAAASHLQFEQVVDACSAYLQGHIEMDNMLDILTIGETYSLSSLEKKAYAFICGNLYAFARKKPSDFQRLTHYQLETCLASNLPVDCTESEVLSLVTEWIVFDLPKRTKYASKLLKHINFKDVSPHDLQQSDFCHILKSISVESSEFISKCTHSNLPGTFTPFLSPSTSPSPSTSSSASSSSSLSTSSSSSLLHKLHDNEVEKSKERGEEAHPNERGDITKGTSLDTSLAREEYPDANDVSTLPSLPSSSSSPSPASSLKSGKMQAGFDERVNMACRLILGDQQSLLRSLLNTRGMELAILKVGGFTMSGITNEITYLKPCKSNAKWKYLTTVPHVEQCNFGSIVYQNQLFIIGGCFNQCMTEQVHPYGFKYDPISNSWSTIATMNSARCRFQLVSCGDMLYALGGSFDDEFIPPTQYSPCEVYNTKSNSWKSIAPMPPSCRSQHAAVTWSKYIYISGGLDCDTELSSVYCYDVEGQKWTEKSPMLAPRADHTMVCINDRIFVCGGWYEEGNLRRLHKTVDVYDISSDTWSKFAEVPSPRFHVAITSIPDSNVICFVGGKEEGASSSRYCCGSSQVDCLDVTSGKWFALSSYPKAVWEHSASVLLVPSTCEEEREDVS